MAVIHLIVWPVSFDRVDWLGALSFVSHLSACPWHVVCSPFHLVHLLVEVLKERGKDEVLK